MKLYKATEEFKRYRFSVIGMDIEEFRKLQKGDAAKVPERTVKKYPHLFKRIKEVKDGN